MANMEHVQLVRRGRGAVAQWREENPNQMLDLNAAYLSHARMPQVNLSGADIRDSDLMGAMLHRANLAGCYLNPCHLYHANLIQANLSRALLNGANLRGANLSEADLSNADLDRAVLSDANLTGANLTNANLSRANLTGADFTDATLTGADLSRAGLNRTTMVNATLQGTDFYEAIMLSPELTGANFSGSIMGYTVFQDCDLGGAEGMDQVRHDAPSTVGIDTLFRPAAKSTSNSSWTLESQRHCLNSSVHCRALWFPRRAALFLARPGTSHSPKPSNRILRTKGFDVGYFQKTLGATRWWTGTAPRTRKRWNGGSVPTTSWWWFAHRRDWTARPSATISMPPKTSNGGRISGHYSWWRRMTQWCSPGPGSGSESQ